MFQERSKIADTAAENVCGRRREHIVILKIIKGELQVDTEPLRHEESGLRLGKLHQYLNGLMTRSKLLRSNMPM
jgi:hypothetical protein